MKSESLEQSSDQEEQKIYDDLYSSYRALKCRTKHTKVTTKIKILLDFFEDLTEEDEYQDKLKCLHDIQYFLDYLKQDITHDR
jgi:hypothetical protein